MNLRDEISRLEGERSKVLGDLSTAETRLSAAQDTLRLADGSIEVLEMAGAAARGRVQEQIGGIMTGAMQDIFGGDSMADVEFTATARGYSARIIVQGGGFRGDPMRTDGGSVCKLLSVALRAAMVKRAPNRPDVLVLDEPFGGIDAKHIHDTAAWLRSVAEGLDMQIILVSHEWPDVWDAHVHQTIDISGEEAVIVEGTV